MRIKESIQKRAKQAAERYKKDFIEEQKGRYEETLLEYEDLLTQYYKQEVKLKFLKAMEDKHPDGERQREIEELQRQHILLLKRVKDIENAGVLGEYDAVIGAIKDINEA